MLRMIRIGTAVAITLLALPAAALEFTGNPGAPQVDEVASRTILQAAIARHPAIFEGADRPGTFLISIIVRPDSQVVRSQLHVAADRAELTQALREVVEQLPSNQGVTALAMNHARGEWLPGNRVLRADLQVHARIVPQDWDAERGEERVRQVVLQRYRELFRPLASGSLNQLTIVLDEQGGIVREQREQLIVEGGRSFRFTRPTPVSFAPLGMKWDDVGVIGQIQMTLFPENPRAVLSSDYSPSLLIVRYAWPRRPGEPAGGENATARGAAPKPREIPETLRNLTLPGPQLSPEATAAFMALEALARQHFPPGSPASGNWMLMDQDRNVLRKGHIDLLAGQRMTADLLVRRMPGIKVTGFLPLGFRSPAPDNGAAPSTTSVYIFTLAPDSPLPPPER